MLSYMLDEDEFLSPYGIRSVSRYHEKHPYELNLDGTTYKVDYVPGESNTHMFGGNSNWRGPIWHCSKYWKTLFWFPLFCFITGYPGWQQPTLYGNLSKFQLLFWAWAPCGAINLSGRKKPEDIFAKFRDLYQKRTETFLLFIFS